MNILRPRIFNGGCCEAAAAVAAADGVDVEDADDNSCWCGTSEHAACRGVASCWSVVVHGNHDCNVCSRFWRLVSAAPSPLGVKNASIDWCVLLAVGVLAMLLFRL